MSARKNGKRTGIGLRSLATYTTILFIILKLTDNIDWSWWWVFSPILMWFTLGVLIISLFGAWALALVAIIMNSEP